MSDVAWEIHVWPPAQWRDTDPKQVVTPEDGIATLQALSFTPQGDSLDGSFTGVPAAGLDIRPRDEVTVYIKDGAGRTRAAYAGIVTTAGNPKSHSEQEYRLAGIRQRFFEILVQWPYVTGGDIGTMVRAVIGDTRHRPGGISYEPENIPDLGFQVGDRAPAWETVGDMLDALAELVGAFIVPPGQSYTYDGHTYLEGDAVPPTEWGVDAMTGRFFFRRRPPTIPLEVSEGDNRVEVMWEEINAEDATGEQVLIYMGSLNLQEAGFISARTYSGPGSQQVRHGSPPPVIPLARHLGLHRPSGYIPHATRTQLDGPVDFMGPHPGPYEASGSETSGDLANLTDGDPNTKVEFIQPSSEYDRHLIRLRRYAGGAQIEEGAWRITYRTPAGYTPEHSRVTYGYVGTENRISQVVARLPSTDEQIRELWLPNLVIATYLGSLSGSLRPFLEIESDIKGRDGSFALYHHLTGVEVFEIEYWIPDSDLYGEASQSALVAKALTIEPAESVALVSYAGLGSLSSEATIYPVDGGEPAHMPVERIVLSIDTSYGIRTDYYAGQAWPAMIQEQRVLLTRLARRAVTDGGRRR